MKQSFITGLFLLVCSALAVFAMPEPEQLSEQAVSPSPEIVEVMAQAENEQRTYDETVTITLLLDDRVEKIPMDKYIAGVLAAEMPSTFHIEALKAQAVAVRTNVMRKLAYGSKHVDADVCSESTCCMGWKQPEQDSCFTAVAETDGLVVSYDGTIIDAVFFASSWGSTEDAVEVWGSAVPYLAAVESPETEVKTETVTVPLTDFCLAVREYDSNADFSADWLGQIVRTDAGAVKTAVIGGLEIPGTKIRSMFGLRSANFDMTVTASGVEFTTYGYGHGVGMSQQGANTMAESGSSFAEILTWYYSGCTVERLGA